MSSIIGELDGVCYFSFHCKYRPRRGRNKVLPRLIRYFGIKLEEQKARGPVTPLISSTVGFTLVAFRSAFILFRTLSSPASPGESTEELVISRSLQRLLDERKILHNFFFLSSFFFFPFSPIAITFVATEESRRIHRGVGSSTFRERYVNHSNEWCTGQNGFPVPRSFYLSTDTIYETGVTTIILNL